MNLERLKTTEHIIAYIDILGGKKLIQEDRLDDNLNKVNEIYTCAKNFLASTQSASVCDVKIKIFSDNILLTLTPETNSEKDKDLSIYNFFALLAFLQMKALERNIFIRGGITVGDICINETFSWGNGLLRAIELEEKYAFYPRIIIDTNALEIFKTITERNPYTFFTMQEFDGWASIDYLRVFGVEQLTTINNNIYFVNSEIVKNNKNPNIIAKLIWQLNYLNGFLACTLPNNTNTPSTLL